MNKRLIWIVAGVLTSGALAAARPFQGEARARQRQLVLERADRAAEDALGSLAVSADPCGDVATLGARAGLFGVRQSFALAVASCINEESGTPVKFAACLQEAANEFNDELALVSAQHAARLGLCTLTGGGIYDPDLDAAEFDDEVDHPYMPFLPGAQWVYQKVTADGLEEITITVTDDKLEIDGIECITVHDVVTLDGVLVEDTLDWYAQHEDETVWYMGEIVQNFEEGRLTDLGGSWLAGADGALPGIVMLANPTLQRTYRQEFFLGEAEDAATVLSVSEVVTIGLGTFTRCLLTEEFTPLTPGGVEHKYYALGVGLILEVDPFTGERLELISFTPGG